MDCGVMLQSVVLDLIDIWICRATVDYSRGRAVPLVKHQRWYDVRHKRVADETAHENYSLSKDS